MTTTPNPRSVQPDPAPESERTRESSSIPEWRVRRAQGLSELVCPSCRRYLAHIPGQAQYLCTHCDHEWLCVRDGAKPTPESVDETLPRKASATSNAMISKQFYVPPGKAEMVQTCQMCPATARPGSDYCSDACFDRGEGFAPVITVIEATPQSAEVCGHQRPGYEHTCTFHAGHGKVCVPEAEDGGEMDHGDPARGAWWGTTPEKADAPGRDAS
jgi:hypothetical protein